MNEDIDLFYESEDLDAFNSTAATQDITFSDLTEDEKAILMGSVLGDGTVQKRGNSYRMRIAYSCEKKEHLQWMQDKLQRFCTKRYPRGEFGTFTGKLSAKDIAENPDKKPPTTCYFYLASGPYLDTLYNLFYQQVPGEERYVKTITKKTIEAFPKNPYLLAVWYMDDGSRRRDCYAGKLYTQSFYIHNLLKKKNSIYLKII